MSSFFIGKITSADLWVWSLFRIGHWSYFFSNWSFILLLFAPLDLKLYPFYNVVLYVTFCDVQTRDEQYLGVHSWYLTLEMN